MALSPGTRLGPYEILSPLGAGGMGQVYRARDSRLDREVAVKVLSTELAKDSEALSRFQLEARAASALNHPHICTVYDVGEHEEAPYLVMERLEGETLLGRLGRGRLLSDEAMSVALDVASALAAAGARGIVHRDLKPANVFLTSAGGAKILDFGLARFTDRPAPVGSDLETETGAGSPRGLTRPGSVMGTLLYMSPEQVRGEPLDARTDLFSFGVILFEMCAGRHPFAARTAHLVAEAILNREPARGKTEERDFPPELAAIIARALEKDVRLRYQTAADLRAELLRVKSRTPSTPIVVPAPAPALPVPLTSFVGRTGELRLVRDALAKERLVTLTGPGGTGKTRLALQAAAELRTRYSDGVFFVPLTTLRNPDLFESAIAQAVGLREVPDVGLADLLTRHFARREVLLVLDNFEHLLAAAPRLVDLLQAAPRLSVLATSRERLHLSAEVDVPVPPLALAHPSGASDLGALAGSESVALFCARVTAVQPGFVLSEDNAATVAEICARLDGLPLAIELAAARIRHLPPAALLSRLSRRLALLTGGARDLPARQQTLRDAIAWSHDLLSADERTLFARLAVFNGGFSLEAAEAVSGALGPLELDVLDIVALLVEKSLVRPLPEANEPRYTMLETIREFALERLAENGEERRARVAHATHFASLATGSTDRLFSERRVSTLAELTTELDNLRAAFAWSASDGEDITLGQVLAVELLNFWIMRNLPGEGRAALQRVLGRMSPAPTSPRARVLSSLALLHWLQGDHEAANACALESVEVSRTLGEDSGVAFALNCLSLVAEARGHHAEARRMVTEAALLYRRLGDESGLAFLMVSAIAPDDLPAARRDALEALGVFRARGDAWNSSRALRNLGVVALREGDFADARRQFEACLKVQRGLGDRWLLSRTLNHLGDIARCLGDLAGAKNLYEESRREEALLESSAHAAWSLAGLGHVALRDGNPGRAARLFGEGLQVGIVRTEKAEHLAACLIGLAETRRLEGDSGAAALLLGAAAPLVAEARPRMVPVDLEIREGCISAVEAALGGTELESARAEAERLGLGEVVKRAGHLEDRFDRGD